MELDLTRLLLMSKPRRIRWLQKQLRLADTEGRISALIDLATELILSYEAKASNNPRHSNTEYVTGLREFKEQALAAYKKKAGV